MLKLTAKKVLETRTFGRAIKIAPVKIRPFTEKDELGSSFLDLEGRRQHIEIGRYLCIGIQDERWTCGEKSMGARKCISELDSEGFRLYTQINPQVILVTLVNEPFCLTLSNGDQWTSQAGVITWNGSMEDTMIMRVIEKNIFLLSYQVLN